MSRGPTPSREQCVVAPTTPPWESSCAKLDWASQAGTVVHADGADTLAGRRRRAAAAFRAFFWASRGLEALWGKKTKHRVPVGPHLPPGLAPHCPAPGQPAPGRHVWPGGGEPAVPQEPGDSPQQRSSPGCLQPWLPSSSPHGFQLWALGNVPEERAREMSAWETRSGPALVLQPCSPWMMCRSSAHHIMQGQRWCSLP